MAIKKKKQKIPSLAKLRRLADRIWSFKVKIAYGGKCAVCGETEGLNSHHIEPRTSNAILRWDPIDGICLCIPHHKYGKDAAHKSTIFFYEFIKERCPRVIEHIRPLRNISLKANEATREQLGRFLFNLWSEIDQPQADAWGFTSPLEFNSKWIIARQNLTLAAWEKEFLLSLRSLNQEPILPV